MTKEEMVDKWTKQNCCECCVNKDDCDAGTIDCFAKEAYIAGAESREKRITELEKACNETQELLDKQIEATYKVVEENKELKTVKIPQLERRIASIRGCHSVDAKKLNARIEQVERLKQENAALKETIRKGTFCGDWNDDVHMCQMYLKHEELQMYIHQLTEAKEILKVVLNKWKEERWILQSEKEVKMIENVMKEAEVFLKE